MYKEKEIRTYIYGSLISSLGGTTRSIIMSVVISNVEKEFGKIHKKAELARQVQLEAAQAAEEAKKNEERIMKEELVLHALIAVPTGSAEEILHIAERIALSHQMKFDDLEFTVTEVLERFKDQDDAKPAKAPPKARGKATTPAPAKTETESAKPKRTRATKAEMAERAAAQAAQAAGGITFPGRIEQVDDDNEDEYDDE
jgi:hypothetical protein